jgi:enamine deaminase RidA (YjgF/YER057c/UK114 family)
LEKIPFEKKLVVETKINKQIRKLSKHVDAVLKSAGPQADITDPVAGGLSVVEVKKAVDTLKMTWEEQARSESDNNSGNKVTVVDPFAELKAKMAERLDILNRYEAGELPKPEWLARFDQTDKSHNNNESKKRKVKASISELQAREHQEERKRRLAVTKQQLRVAQLEKVKVYNQLRELQKKMSGEEALTPTPKTTKSKTVTWKDGLKSSGVSRVRKLLEQVHYYDPYELDDGDQEDALDDAINMEDVALEIPELEEQASDRQFDDVMDEAELANNNCDPINDEGSPDEELTEQPWV